jgi:MFS family permease
VSTTVLAIGVAQLVSWGLSYYAIGVFGERIAADTGWGRDLVYGGFSLALVVMAVASPPVGAAIDRGSGRAVMAIGAAVTAAGCLALARAGHPATYLLAWAVLGIAMRMTLYDAAFALLVRIAGAGARPAMAQVTLFGGLASTVFWPIGDWLAVRWGWRGALDVYAVIALAALPLPLTVPRHDGAVAPPPPPPLTRGRPPRGASALFVAITAAAQLLNAGMSAHMIALLGGVGLSASAAVWMATLRGIGQSGARLGEVVLGGRLSPAGLQTLSAALTVAGFAAAVAAGSSAVAAALFALAFGAGNGLATIARGSLPLVLFPPHAYGATTGWLLAPSFVAAAAAPLLYAAVIDWLGAGAALLLSLALATGALGGAWALHAKLRR